MNRMGYFRTGWIAAVLMALPVAAWAPTALAQGANYDVKTINFDLLCQEQQHLAPERCDKRTPDDEKDFEAYRAKIEQYEIPYLQQKQKDIALDRNILNKDPVDNPISSDSQTQSLQNQRQQSIDTRTPKP